MGQPDFKAFQEFMRAEGNGSALTIVRRNNNAEPGRNYVHLDLAAYSTTSATDQTRIRNTVGEHLRTAGASQDVIIQYNDFMDMAAREPVLAASGGGGLFARGLVMTDGRSISQSAEVEDVLQRDVTANMGRHDEFAREKVRRHEIAHATLDLEEPGSDFVAAATMLRDHPESRAMWRNEADLRLVYGLQRGVPALSDYGVECHDAIERALAMTPAQLKSASLQTLHAIGAEYDQRNALNRSLGAASPEGRVLATISSATGHGMYDRSLRSQWEVAARGDSPEPNTALEGMRLNASTTDAMLRALERSPPTNPEEKRISEAFSQSVARLSQYATPETPAPASTPAPRQPEFVQ